MKKKINLNCRYILDHPCRILVPGGFGSGKNKYIT